MSHSIDSEKFQKLSARKQAQTLTNLMLQGKHDEVQLLIKVSKKGFDESDNQKRIVEIPNRNPSIKKNPKSRTGLYKKDFCTSDEFRYNASQNSDSNRSNMEVLGGSGSNMYRGRRR